MKAVLEDSEKREEKQETQMKVISLGTGKEVSLAQEKEGRDSVVEQIVSKTKQTKADTVEEKVAPLTEKKEDEKKEDQKKEEKENLPIVKLEDMRKVKSVVVEEIMKRTNEKSPMNVISLNGEDKQEENRQENDRVLCIPIRDKNQLAAVVMQEIAKRQKGDTKMKVISLF